MKVFILGYPVDTKEQITNCCQMMYLTIKEALQLLPDVEIVFSDSYKKAIGLNHPTNLLNKRFVLNKTNELPLADVVIINEQDDFFTPATMAILKRKYKKVVSYLELSEVCDFSFIFYPNYYRQPVENCCVLPGPYNEHFYSNVPKTPKTILLDHSCWLGSQWPMREKSSELLQWIDELKDEYKISTLVYPAVQGELHKKLIPGYVAQIEMCDFMSYLEQTSKMETFIVTHYGSYNLSVLDMLVRGIRIITYDTFIPRYNIDRFSLPLYSDKKSFIEEVRKPIDIEFWNNQKERCSDLLAIAKAFDEYFKKI